MSSDISSKNVKLTTDKNAKLARKPPILISLIAKRETEGQIDSKEYIAKTQLSAYTGTNQKRLTTNDTALANRAKQKQPPSCQRRAAHHSQLLRVLTEDLVDVGRCRRPPYKPVILAQPTASHKIHCHQQLQLQPLKLPAVGCIDHQVPIQITVHCDSSQSTNCKDRLEKGQCQDCPAANSSGCLSPYTNHDCSRNHQYKEEPALYNGTTDISHNENVSRENTNQHSRQSYCISTDKMELLKSPLDVAKDNLTFNSSRLDRYDTLLPPIKPNNRTRTRRK